MMRLVLLMSLGLWLVACGQSGSCDQPETEAEVTARAAAGQAWPKVRTTLGEQCPGQFAGDALLPAWQRGNAEFCDDPANGWRQQIDTPERDVRALCDESHSGFHAAVRLAEQWMEWMLEHQALMQQAEQAPEQERGAILAQAQRIKRDLDMLRGIADTRGYPTDRLPDWRERDQLPRPQDHPQEDTP